MNKLSIVRNNLHKRLSKLVIDGSILDLGGSKKFKNGYQSFIKGDHNICTVNIDVNYGCDLVFDIENKFPLNDYVYDSILCFNVLEHIYNFQNVINESYRVLKNDGSFFGLIPFMHHIHGCPNDYFRYSESCIRKIFLEGGFKNIYIDRVGSGIFSLFFQSIDCTFLTKINILRIIFKIFFIFLDKTLIFISPKYKKLTERFPLAYFIIAKK